jgi:hypothetical protein
MIKKSESFSESSVMTRPMTWTRGSRVRLFLKMDIRFKLLASFLSYSVPPLQNHQSINRIEQVYLISQCCDLLVNEQKFNFHPKLHKCNKALLLTAAQWGCTTGNAATVAHSTKKPTSGIFSVIEGQPLLLFM